MKTERGTLITRRRFERRLDEVFGASKAARVMHHARIAGLISTGKQGVHYERPLLPPEQAALILVMALVTATSLHLGDASELVIERQDWIENAQSVACTGEDLVLQHAFGHGLAVEVTIRNTVLRDPVLGPSGAGGVAMEMAA